MQRIKMVMKRIAIPPAAPTATYTTKSVFPTDSKWVAIVFDNKSVALELIVLFASVQVVVSDCVVASKFMSCSEAFILLSDPLTVELNLAESVDNQH